MNNDKLYARLLKGEKLKLKTNFKDEVNNFSINSYLSLISFSDTGGGPPDAELLGTRLNSGYSDVRYTGTMVDSSE